MFDQTFVRPGKQRRWVYLIGLTGELAAIGFLMLLPLIYTDRLSPSLFTRLGISTPNSGDPKPVHRSKTQRATAPNYVKAFDRHTLFAYTRIPARVNATVDEPLDTAEAPGVPGGMGAPSAVSETLKGLMAISSPPPPEPKPVESTTTKPPREQPKLIRVSSGVQAALIVRKVVPVYPPLAKQARVEGVVRLEGIIARDGTIQQLRVVSGHPLLIQAAVDAVRQWLYRPTLLSGEPVEVSAPIEVNFALAQR